MKAAPPYYINGIGIISPQKTYDPSEFLTEITAYPDNVLSCQVPDFKRYIPPQQIRRLSKMLKMGLSAAAICMEDSGGQSPDGIITATGYGLINDTEKFLNEILQQDEKHLTPTFFMQSTYNALSGLVGLALKCTGYNNTHVSRGFALEMALYDGITQLRKNLAGTFLIGGFDEANEVHYNVHSRVGYFKKEHINSLDLFEHPTRGTVQGEGAAFFSLSGYPGSNTWCALLGIKMVFLPESEASLTRDLHEFLSLHSLQTKDVDVLISGESGDPVHDLFVAGITHEIFPAIPRARFKHLCGEYCTASSFGLWLSASILKRQLIPTGVALHQQKGQRLRTALLINQYMGRNYSFLLLQTI